MELMVPQISIYLSGHLHYEESDWRPLVIDHIERSGANVHWLIPLRGVRRLEGEPERKGDSALYVPREKLAVQQADLIFTVIEDVARNIGTTWEHGFACGLGKTVILVNLCEDILSYDFLEQSSDAVFSTLEEGMEALEFMVRPGSDHGMEVKRAKR